MRTLSVLTALLALTCVSISCGGDDEDEELPDVECPTTPVKYEEVTAFTKCATCHSSTKMGAARAEAPTDINFDTEAAAKAHAMKAASEVNEGAMPPKATGITLTDAEKDTLYKWALCMD
jgi:uncharacterized membrane protein